MLINHHFNQRRLPHCGHDAEWQAASQKYQPDNHSRAENAPASHVWEKAKELSVKTKLQILATETSHLQHRLAELYPELARSQQMAA